MIMNESTEDLPVNRATTPTDDSAVPVVDPTITTPIDHGKAGGKNELPCDQSTSQTSSQKKETSMFSSRMGLNDNKAGMQGLDKERINKIIMDATKGSRFYENEKKKDLQVTKRINAHKAHLSLATPTQLASCKTKADVVLSLLRQERDLSRYIVHIDMDAFYAAVEMRENPKLQNVPMAVGGEDMLSTSNYIARRFGVRAAMPGFIARKLCPNLIIVPTHFSLYREVSKEMQSILAIYNEGFSPNSLDEAHLDFTDHMQACAKLPESAKTFPAFCEGKCRCESSAGTDENINESKCPTCGCDVNEEKITFGDSIEEAVKEMRHRIHLKTRLTASAGIANNLMLAKICSDMNKPNGQFRVQPEEESIMKFLAELPIRKVCGIGKVSEKILISLGVEKCKDFYQHRDKLNYLFSDTSFDYFMSIYLGIGSNHITRNEEGPKSKSVERTFGTMSDPAKMMQLCHELCTELAEDLQNADLKIITQTKLLMHIVTEINTCSLYLQQGRTVTLKIKMITFVQKTRAQSLKDMTNDAEDIFRVASALLKNEMKVCESKPLKLRLMGVRMSNFATEATRQLKLTEISKQGETVDKYDSSEDSDSGPSFFEMVLKERASNPAPSRAGLDSFIQAKDTGTIWDTLGKSTSNKRKKSNDLTKFTSERIRDIWDELSPPHSHRKKRKQQKGAIQMVTLQDSDSVSSANSADQESKDSHSRINIHDILLEKEITLATRAKASKQASSTVSTPNKANTSGPMTAFVTKNAEARNIDPFLNVQSTTSKSAKVAEKRPGALDKFISKKVTSLWDDSCIIELPNEAPQTTPNVKKKKETKARGQREVTCFFSNTTGAQTEEVFSSSSDDDILCNSGSNSTNWRSVKYLKKSDQNQRVKGQSEEPEIIMLD